MPEFLASLKTSLRFTQGDAECLMRLRARMGKRLPELIDEVIGREAGLEVLRPGLIQWLDCLLEGPWDSSYSRKRAEIARQHAELDLRPHQIQLAMASAVELLMVRATDLAGAEQATMMALQKLSSIDLALMLKSNRERHVNAVQDRQKSRRDHTLAALGTLTSGLAHEIRNPLNAAQLQLALVERELAKAGDAVGARGRRASQLVKSELHRLSGLLNDFIAFARPLPLNPTELDVGVLCREVLESLSGLAASMGVELRESIEHGQLTADHGRIEQALTHLLQNAIEAAGDGGDVFVSCVHSDSDVVRIEFHDSGLGFPEDVDMFEPFASTKETGTGLGLPIAQRGIADHQGSLTTLRKDGRTIVAVELPRS